MSIQATNMGGIVVVIIIIIKLEYETLKLQEIVILYAHDNTI